MDSLTVARIEPISVLLKCIQSVVILREETTRITIAAVLAGGHVLLDDVPGTGKTLFARTFATLIGGTFKRIQFTPDLLPGDITGGYVYNQRSSEFSFIPGPIFANIVLADEINRATPRTQSSLLEAMAEGQVTVEGDTKPLPRPFVVIATENPVESYGTFPLPEAQLDRFLVRLSLGYPSEEDEVVILERTEHADPIAGLRPVVLSDQIATIQDEVRMVRVSLAVKQYIVKLVRATRSAPGVLLGASPRGAVGLQRMGQALALMHGRDYVLPDDIKRAASATLSHRLVVDSARLSSTDVIDRILTDVAVPVDLPCMPRRA